MRLALGEDVPESPPEVLRDRALGALSIPDRLRPSFLEPAPDRGRGAAYVLRCLHHGSPCVCIVDEAAMEGVA